MGRVSQNYSHGKHSPLFTGKNNCPKKRSRGGEKNKYTEEKVSSAVESWKKKRRGTMGMVGVSVSDPFLSDVSDAY